MSRLHWGAESVSSLKRVCINTVNSHFGPSASLESELLSQGVDTRGTLHSWPLLEMPTDLSGPVSNFIVSLKLYPWHN